LGWTNPIIGSDEFLLALDSIEFQGKEDLSKNEAQIKESLPKPLKVGNLPVA